MAQFETDAIHAEREIVEVYGAVAMPVFQASTFRLENPDTSAQWVYARAANPTRSALEAAVSKIENGNWGVAFASGMAATTAVAGLLRPGDHIVASNDLYGGSFRLFSQLLARQNITVSFVDTTSPEATREACTLSTRLVFVETPSNPRLDLSPLDDLAEVAHAHEAVLCVDNTIATPYLQNPLDHGADLVLHSTTKYLGGHSDLLGGAVVGRVAPLYEEISLFQRGFGAVPGAMDCFLVLRGIKTLAVRMARQCETAHTLARMLSQRDDVIEVHYPGLSSSQLVGPGRQMRSGGAIVSLRLGDARRAVEFVKRLRNSSLAMSLGGVESLCEVPATMTHALTAGSECAVPDDLVRLSMGLEHEADLAADILEALESLAPSVVAGGGSV